MKPQRLQIKRANQNVPTEIQNDLLQPQPVNAHNQRGRRSFVDLYVNRKVAVSVMQHGRYRLEDVLAKICFDGTQYHLSRGRSVHVQHIPQQVVDEMQARVDDTDILSYRLVHFGTRPKEERLAFGTGTGTSIVATVSSGARLLLLTSLLFLLYGGGQKRARTYGCRQRISYLSYKTCSRNGELQVHPITNDNIRTNTLYDTTLRNKRTNLVGNKVVQIPFRPRREFGPL